MKIEKAVDEIKQFIYKSIFTFSLSNIKRNQMQAKSLIENNAIKTYGSSLVIVSD